MWRAARVLPPSYEIDPAHMRGVFRHRWRAEVGELLELKIDHRQEHHPIVQIIVERIPRDDGISVERWGEPQEAYETDYVMHYVWKDPACGVVATGTKISNRLVIHLPARKLSHRDNPGVIHTEPRTTRSWDP